MTGTCKHIVLPYNRKGMGTKIPIYMHFNVRWARKGRAQKGARGKEQGLFARRAECEGSDSGDRATGEVGGAHLGEDLV